MADGRRYVRAPALSATGPYPRRTRSEHNAPYNKLMIETTMKCNRRYAISLLVVLGLVSDVAFILLSGCGGAIRGSASSPSPAISGV